MKKRIIAMLLALSLMTGITGCGNSTTNTTGNISSESAQEANKVLLDSEVSNDNKLESSQEEFESNNELNIIEDNYRNYYEIFVYSFYDSDGDGIGDINGVTEKLDYIKDMGFNGIWLTPIFESPSYHKYDTTDYYIVDPEFGTNDDLKNLINECHSRNIRIIMDLALNHTSSKHSWFKEASKYLRELPANKEPDVKECKYVDYYNFSKEKITADYYNVLSSEWLYEGVFWSEMPDLNLHSEYVREEIENIAKYWLEFGIDGFRMDAAMHYEESDITFNTEFMNWFYNYCKSINEDVYMVSEVWSGQSEIAKYYQSKTPSMFNFGFAGNEGKLIKGGRGKYKASSFVQALVDLKSEIGQYYSEYIDAPFLTNHDMPRVANNLVSNVQDMKMACALMMTMNGSPFVYYGEEIGMCSKGDKDENKRLPMIWSSKDYTGMTKGPEGADKNIESKFESVEEQLQDKDSILNFYKKALRLRNENPEIARGIIEIIDSLTNEHQAVITKTYEGSTIVICYNTASEECEINLTGTQFEKFDIRGYLTTDGTKILIKNNVMKLPGKSICILKKNQ